ncbi:hypothetical protein ACFVWN_01240 [Nocardiopsis flavescens]|uniref:hypothetical protein n=1 Tax=Nocardiopsis flavescens TaxID=758803 RepID=UPI00365AF81E
MSETAPEPAEDKNRTRGIKMLDSLFDPAAARAAAEGTDVSNVVRSHLRVYGKQLPGDAVTADPWDVINFVTQQLLDGRVGPETDLAGAHSYADGLLRALGVRSTKPSQK